MTTSVEDFSKTVPKAVERYVERLKVDTIFGAPQQQGDITIIPVAEVHARLGYGFGGGSGPVPQGMADEDESGDAPAVMGGNGAGAGGTGDATPRGFIELGPDGARWVPIEDRQKVAIAGIALAGWMVFWGTLTARTIVRALASKGS